MKRTRASVRLFLPIDVLNDSRASSVAQLESTCNAGDLGSIPGLGRSPGERKGYPLQYSGLENSMDRVVLGGCKVRHNWVTFTFTFKWFKTDTMEAWCVWWLGSLLFLHTQLSGTHTPAWPRRVTGPVQSVWFLKLWPPPSAGLPRGSGFTWSPLTDRAQQPAQSWLVSWLELSEAHGVRSCCCELLSQGLPNSHQTVLATFDLGLNRAVPRASHYAASSSLENALQVTAQQTEETKCSQRRKAQKFWLLLTRYFSVELHCEKRFTSSIGIAGNTLHPPSPSHLTAFVSLSHTCTHTLIHCQQQ